MRLLSAAALIGCGALVLAPACFIPQPQWTLVVRTDAYVPSWGDRLLLEVLRDDGTLACGDCRREFVLDSLTLPLSFGLVATDRAVHVRARLYQHAQTGADGLPAGTDLIDFVGQVGEPPKVAPFPRLLVPLFGLCFGIPANLAEHTSCYADGANGFVSKPEQILVEADDELDSPTLSQGKVDRIATPCPTEVPEGLTCLPARTFILGDHDGLGTETDYPTAPRTFIMPVFPIGVGTEEVTVGAVRALVRSGAFKPTAADLLVRDGTHADCTYLGKGDASNDDLPINCISRRGAYAACAALDQELLTESEWEQAARGVEQNTPYPWGNDEATCERAILSVSTECVRTGPVAGGAATDVTPLGIRNLGGNLSEWVSTPLVSYADACWRPIVSETGVSVGYSDACDLEYARWKGPFGHRGGSYASGARSARSTSRYASTKGDPEPTIGFRCKQVLF